MDYRLFWFTGQAGAGKTTIAHILKNKLENMSIDKTIGKKFVIVDGDDIRDIFSNQDYSKEGREKQVLFVQKLCSFLIKNNIIPIVCMVSPFAEQRKNFIDLHNGFEIYLHTSELRGREHYHVDYYEVPDGKRKNVAYINTDGTIDETINTINYTLFNDEKLFNYNHETANEGNMLLSAVPTWKFELEKIKDCPQRQDSLCDQLRDLRIIANKFGFYDASDFLKGYSR